MNTLITGGAGFIGSHLVEELVSQKEKEDKITVVDDLSEGDWDNIDDCIMSKDGVDFFPCSILQLDAMPFGKIDVVYHLAAKHTVPLSFVNPGDYFTTNITGSWKVFEAFKKARIVNISSSSAAECKSPYGISKRAAELAAELFPNVVSLRLFNVFGERQPYTGCVIPAFCKAILTKKRPIIYGDGEQSRDFTYVKDVVKEIVRYGNGGYKNEKGVHDVGYGESTTVNYLFDQISRLLNYEGKPKHVEERQGDVRYTQASRKMYCPEYGFREGLKRAVDWQKKKYI